MLYKRLIIFNVQISEDKRLTVIYVHLGLVVLSWRLLCLLFKRDDISF